MKLFRIVTVCTAGLFLVGTAMAASEGSEGMMGQDQGSTSGEYSQPIGSSSEPSSSAMEQQQGMDQQQVAAGSLDSEQIRQIQENLKKEGIEAGPVDGIMGPKTQEGLRNFQQEEGLAATGEPNQETLEALGVQEFTGVSPRFEEQDSSQQSPQQGEMEQPDSMQQEQDSERLDHLQPEGALDSNR